MPNTNLTTKDVARLLRVSEATVKRWADSGALELEKTIGGHRRFSVHAVARMRRDGSLKKQGKVSKQRPIQMKSTKPLILPSDFLRSILAGDEETTSAALINAYLRQHALAKLFDGPVTDAMHAVGEMWFKGEIGVADEHLATRTVNIGLQNLRAAIAPADLNGLKAICCGIEGDLHELPVHLAELLLTSQGWMTINLGPNTPLFALRDMVLKERPQLVCICARNIMDLDRATTEYASLRKAAQKFGTVLITGGEAFSDPVTRERFPADACPGNFAELLKVTKAIVARSSSL